mgnify:CR=1 FL=1
MRTWEELSEKEQLLTYISDVNNDARGFRPRGMYNDLSVPELEKVLDDLSEESQQEALRIEKLEDENWKGLKKHLSNLVDMGAKDFRQALAWDIQAEDCEHEGWVDYGFYCYKKGIAYRKERVLTRLAA